MLAVRYKSKHDMDFWKAVLAFFLHTFLMLVDTRYKAVREELVARRTFFNDIRSLMRYQVFDSWEALLHFMAVGLEVEPP